MDYLTVRCDLCGKEVQREAHRVRRYQARGRKMYCCAAHNLAVQHAEKRFQGIQLGLLSPVSRPCSTCGAIKPASSFASVRGYVCDECKKRRQSRYGTERYRTDPKTRQQQAMYREAHRDEIRAYHKLHYGRNREEILAKGQARYSQLTDEQRDRRRRQKARARWIRPAPLNPLPKIYSLNATPVSDDKNSWLRDDSGNPELIILEEEKQQDLRMMLANYKRSNPAKYAAYCEQLGIDDPIAGGYASL